MINTYTNDYRGCKVYIHELEHGTTLAISTIKEFDKPRLIVIVEGDFPVLKENQKISLLILCKDTLWEYQGITRRKDSFNNWEIAMFRGREKENRHSIRYTLNAPAKIEKLITSNLSVPLKTYAKTQIVNISTNGILIRTTLNLLNIGTCFQIKLNVSSNCTTLTACVERIHCITGEEIEYGCRLINKI